MKIKIVFIACLTLLLTSCVQQTKYVAGVKVDNANQRIQESSIDISKSAKKIAKSLQELSEIQRAVHPAMRLPKMPDAKLIGMDQIISIDWTGPIEPLMRNLAKITKYKLKILGKAPIAPIIVSVQEEKATSADVLRNAAFQCGDKVDIVAYPRSKIIELRYARI